MVSVGGCEKGVVRIGCSITASPEWGSRCKALIAPRSLSLLCDRPLQSCPLPRQLQQDTGCVREGEKTMRGGEKMASKDKRETVGSTKNGVIRVERQRGTKERKDVYQMCLRGDNERNNQLRIQFYNLYTL